MRHLERFRALALTCVLALLVSACAAAIPFIHHVATIVADLTGALDEVESQVRARPSADPALVARVLDAIEKARKTARVVQAAADTAEGVSSKDYLAAVDALMDAYDAATELGKEFGVLQAPREQRARMGASRAGIALVPTAGELRARLLREPRS